MLVVVAVLFVCRIMMAMLSIVRVHYRRQFLLVATSV